MVLKFGDFLLEAKKDKNVLVELLVKMLKDKPSLKMGETFPSEKGAYTMAGIKKYFKEHGHTAQNADDVMYSLANDKEFKGKYKIDHFQIKNHYYNEPYPYHYMDLSQEEVTKMKERLSKESEEQAKPKIEQREAATKKAAATREVKAEKRSTARKTPKKAPAKKAPAKKPTDKGEAK